MIEFSLVLLGMEIGVITALSVVNHVEIMKGRDKSNGKREVQSKEDEK